MPESVPILRTIVYVDGYNLYYSALTRTSYKWLDLRMLMTRLLLDAYPGAQGRVDQLKFFTAPILGRYTSDSESPTRQQRYHNALRFAPSGPTDIIYGYHNLMTKQVRPLEPPLNAHGLIRAEVLEEKQTDVNIGLHMYRDAAHEAAQQLVLMSNDSDLAPALMMIAGDYPHIIRGVIFPTTSRQRGYRQSGQLANAATWARRHIAPSDLANCQLPRTVRNRKGKPIIRPTEWD
jgi:6-hydroxy-3-succinoylpyridine 3-monooxygenase